MTKATKNNKSPLKPEKITGFLPKIGVAVTLAIFIPLIITGIYRDSTDEICTGFMGAKSSCFEATVLWPYGLVAFALFIFFGAWWTINYMDKAIGTDNREKTGTKKK